jgi:hypothetical protein
MRATLKGEKDEKSHFDELHIDVMPVFLGGGLRPFEDIGTEQIQLERMKVVELPAGRTHLSFRIVRQVGKRSFCFVQLHRPSGRGAAI